MPSLRNAFPSLFLPLLLRNAQCFRVAEIGLGTSYFQKNSRDVMFPDECWTGLVEKALRNFLRKPFKKKRVRQSLSAEVC
jgi:hypothetical protein